MQLVQVNAPKGQAVKSLTFDVIACIILAGYVSQESFHKNPRVKPDMQIVQRAPTRNFCERKEQSDFGRTRRACEPRTSVLGARGTRLVCEQGLFERKSMSGGQTLQNVNMTSVCLSEYHTCGSSECFNKSDKRDRIPVFKWATIKHTASQPQPLSHYHS